MKKIAFNIFAVAALAVGLASCDQKSEPIDNMVYVGEAVSGPSSDLALGTTGEVSNTKITVSMARQAAADTKVTVALDQNTLDKFNGRNESDYAMIPAEYVEFPSEVTIEAGKSSVDVPVTITSFEGEAGVEYAVPFSIKSADGQAISTGSGSYVLTLGKKLTQFAPGFVSSNAMVMPWDAEVETDNLTLEWWSRVTNAYGTGGYSINNQALFSFVANAEIYIRFGDITYGSKYNFLQIKTMGIDANYDSGDPATNPLKWGEWIHWAHTYNNATGECILYQNGVEVCRVTGPSQTWKITGLNMCSAGSYHRDVIEMAQVRMWKTCRSATQIAKNYKKAVKYDDPNLIFYLPMNEGSGSVLHDVTGNGHDVTIGSNSNGGNANAKSWTEYTFE